ncbi:hypothetical protein, partial [Porphyrobacter sp. CCH7-A1]
QPGDHTPNYTSLTDVTLHFGHCDPETRQVGLQAGRWKMPPKTIPENTFDRKYHISENTFVSA